MNDSYIAERLWEDLKFRQSHYWASFHRFSLAIILIDIAPYIRPEIVEPLGKMIFIFPLTALVISIVCTWYLGAEYQRLDMVRAAYQKILDYDKLVPKMPLDNKWNKIVAIRMGATTSVAFGVGFSVASVVNFVVLWSYPFHTINNHALVRELSVNIWT